MSAGFDKPSGIVVRRAVSEDVPGMMELLRQVLLVHHRIRPDLFKAEGTKYDEAGLVDIISDDSKPIFVAIDADGAVVGHCFTSVEEKGHGGQIRHKTLYIDDLCILDDRRGEGIGRLLYDAAEAYARDGGFYNITLHVWTGNDSARAFYAARGFKTYMEAMEIIL